MLLCTRSNAAPYDIADQPLFLVTNVAPNIALTLDDSGSMQRAFVPDSLDTSGVRFRSKNYNALYYDPSVSYTAPVNENGMSLSTSWPSAYINGFDSSRGTRNLTSNYLAITHYDPSSTSETSQITPAASSDLQADYYLFDASNSNCDGTAGDNDCYDRIVVSSSSGPAGSDERQNFANWYSFYRSRNLAVGSASSLAFTQLSSEVRVAWQNLHSCDGFDTSCQGWTSTNRDSRIAKFETTHRSDFYNWLFRLPASGGTPLRTALIRAGDMFAGSRPYELDPGVTSSPVHACRQNYSIVMTDGRWNSDTVTIGNIDGSSSTLPDSVSYTAIPPYQDDDSDSLADIAAKYWSTDLKPSLVDSAALKFMPINTNETIAYDDPSNGSGVDASSTVIPYWNPKNDPATWQHMVNFTVGVGLSNALTESNLAWTGDTYSSGYDALATGYADWPDTGSGIVPGNIYDLWHAAINSRGQFFSAETPDALVTAFDTIIQRIQSRQGSASNLSLNSGSVSSFSQFYQAIFDSKDWSGHLLARPISDGTGNLSCTTEARGELCPPAWDAGCALTGGSCASTGSSTSVPDWDADREVLTYNGTAGVPFRWTNLTAAQQAELQDGGTVIEGQNRLNYLHGDRSQEQQNSGALRDRDILLGDIVHSSPTYVGPPDKDYPTDASWVDLLSGATPENSATTQYGGFQSAHHTRLNVVYVGSNDGFVHGFRSGSFDTDDSFIEVQNDGREVLAYVPTQAYDYLSRLTDPNYRAAGLHKYFADGEMEATDVYFNGSWHTVLVGGLGAGGQGIYALDITDPSNFDESNASSLVLWEFTDDYDDGTYDADDLGYTFGQPHTVRLHNGKWGVLVGNGVNNTFADGNVSTTGNAALYILDIETGTVMAKLDTGIGVSASYSGGKPNGLANITPIDLDGDVVTDYVYAGDLYGNVWRFDLTDTSEANWSVDDFGSGTIRPLFVAIDTNVTPKRQPITTKVLVDNHPLGRAYGVMVFVGTGKYFEDSDNIADTSTEHSMYGVWDAHFPGFSNIATYGTPTVAYDITRSNLQPQPIQYDFFNPVHGERQRILSDSTVNWSTQVGWVVDLLAGNSTYDDNSTPADSSDDTVSTVTTYTREGEMIVANPVIIGDTIVASTLIPNPDACSSGGDGWIMVFNKLTGGRLGYAPFYKVVDSKPIQGIKVVGSTIGTPTFVSKQLLLPLGDTSAGAGGVMKLPFHVRGEGRQSWRGLR